MSNKAERQNRESTLVAICENIHEEVQNNDGKMPYGLVSLLAREWHSKFPWITRNVVNKRYMKYKKQQVQGREIVVDVVFKFMGMNMIIQFKHVCVLSTIIT